MIALQLWHKQTRIKSCSTDLLSRDWYYEYELYGRVHSSLDIIIIIFFTICIHPTRYWQLYWTQVKKHSEYISPYRMYFLNSKILVWHNFSLGFCCNLLIYCGWSKKSLLSPVIIPPPRPLPWVIRYIRSTIHLFNKEICVIYLYPDIFYTNFGLMQLRTYICLSSVMLPVQRFSRTRFKHYVFNPNLNTGHVDFQRKLNSNK